MVSKKPIEMLAILALFGSIPLNSFLLGRLRTAALCSLQNPVARVFAPHTGGLLVSFGFILIFLVIIYFYRSYIPFIGRSLRLHLATSQTVPQDLSETDTAKIDKAWLLLPATATFLLCITYSYMHGYESVQRRIHVSQDTNTEMYEYMFKKYCANKGKP